MIELVEITHVADQPLTLAAVPGPTDPDAPAEFTETPSGLKYRILRKSDGDKPGRFDIAVMHMRTWRGEIAVHSSYPQDTPIRRGLTAMTPGMAEGLQLIGKGGMIELLIPPTLRPAAPSPELEYAPGETMRHIVELVDIESIFTVRVTSADIPEKFEITDTGLKYRIILPSDGRRPKLNDEVTVNYIGWLHNGSEFDGTYQRGRPSTFRLDAGVIKGWREGLQLIGEKGLIELEIPSHLGYGLLGNPPRIPPDETLHFAIELLEVH
jgi:FKBP-type peptidyl-prolyl cis-trans isomerase FkpA